MHGNHLKHMLIGGAMLFAVLLIAGVPLATALPYAAALACPLMMIFMMSSMGGHGGHGGGHGDHDDRAIGQPRSGHADGQQPARPEEAPDGTPSTPRR